jgi:hypothetical protein
VTNTVDAAADGRFTSITFTLFGPIVRWLMARRLREELASLRTELEGRVATAPTA